MSKLMQTTIPCIQCRQPFRATFQNVIDAKQDPQAKMKLLTGQLNLALCPNCGTPNPMLTPLVYHDPAKELVITFVPMELGLAKEAQEKAIGDLMRELTTQLPQGAFKGYLLQPRQALTMQGLVDQILQADGVTPEMMEAQRARVRLVEMLLEAPDEEIPALIEQNDGQIDSQLMQTVTLLAQRMLQEGRQGVAERLLMLQNQMVAYSTFGKQLAERSRAQEAFIEQAANEINALGPNAQRADFMNLAIHHADSIEYLQALVGLVRPVFDYAFFQELQVRIGQSPAAERPKLEALRENLLELTAQADQQTRMALQNAAGLLQTILNSPDPEAVIAANLPLIDYTFLQVLSANLQEAERRGDANAGSRLKAIYNLVVAMLQADMPPELQFINEVLAASSDEDARAVIAQRIGEFDGQLLEAIEAVEEQLADRSEPVLLERLNWLREEAIQSFS
ncbi:MAG: hypothetical protein BroJett038_16350 [Chloroflexota bacterium]|nr:MAG: hypothetical protein BroJett038_16350 [Chloroflexota bacterium]